MSPKKTKKGADDEIELLDMGKDEEDRDNEGREPPTGKKKSKGNKTKGSNS